MYLAQPAHQSDRSVGPAPAPRAAAAPLGSEAEERASWPAAETGPGANPASREPDWHSTALNDRRSSPGCGPGGETGEQGRKHRPTLPGTHRDERHRGDRKGRLWNEFVARYHYLGYKTLVGAQMRYAVHDRDGWPIAMLGFSTAAWKLASRDNFIGWTTSIDVPWTELGNVHNCYGFLRPGPCGAGRSAGQGLSGGGCAGRGRTRRGRRLQGEPR